MRCTVDVSGITESRNATGSSTVTSAYVCGSLAGSVIQTIAVRVLDHRTNGASVRSRTVVTHPADISAHTHRIHRQERRVFVTLILLTSLFQSTRITVD